MTAEVGADQVTRSGVSYRRLDTWTAAGYLKAAGAGRGPGKARSWAPTELLVARLMAYLVDHAGLSVEAAHRVARGARELAPGVRVQVDVRAALHAAATTPPPPRPSRAPRRTTLARGEHIVGAARQAVVSELVERYGDGESIRALARSFDRSYGWVHRTLVDAGVEMRARGWAGRVPVRSEGGRS